MIDGLKVAASHMQAALDSLDTSGAPPQLGAHLDMAICRTREIMADLVAQFELNFGRLVQNRTPSDIDSGRSKDTCLLQND